MASSSKKESQQHDLMETLRWAGRAVAVLLMLAGGLYAFHETEQHLIGDQRYVLAGPPEYGMDPPGLILKGAASASRKEILNVFAQDYGKSLYLLPVEERREQLRRIEWVKDASVARLWPNRVMVKVEERVPVAMLKADANRGWLVDADGTLLRIPPQVAFSVPVVRGVDGKDPPPRRGERIKRMLRVIAESGRFGPRFLMVDVSDMDNVKVKLPVNDRKLTLWLGGHNFQSRLDVFEASYPKIMREMPDDSVFDLRLDNRISNVPDNKGE